MAVNKVAQSNGTTLIDISPTTAVDSDVASGKIFFLANGLQSIGIAESGGDSYVRTTIVEETRLTVSGNEWTLAAPAANIVEGITYIVTVNGVEKISTATKAGTINYVSFIDWDWSSGGYAFGTEPPYNGVYFRAVADGNYIVKVEQLELTA